jgi:pimeloyl-ACP methyl ester carboxylesterase
VLRQFRDLRQSRTIATASVRLTAWRLGSGPPLYLLPGFAGNHELFALLAWLLKDSRECVLLDPPDLAARSRSRPEAVLRELVEALGRLADELQHESLSLHATSLGGLWALASAVQAPARIRRLSIQAGFARRQFSGVERAGLTALSRWPAPLSRLPTVRTLLDYNHARWFPPFDLTRWQFCRETLLSTPLPQLALRARLAQQLDLRADLPRVEVPVLLVATEGEGSLLAAAREELTARLPRCRVESLDNTGQLPHVTHPHRLAKLLSTFLAADCDSASDSNEQPDA